MTTQNKIIIPREFRHPAIKLDKLHQAGKDELEAVTSFSYSAAYRINKDLRSGHEMREYYTKMHERMLSLTQPVERELSTWRGLLFGPKKEGLPHTGSWVDPGWSSTSLVKAHTLDHADLIYTDHDGVDDHSRYLLRLHIQPGVQVLPTCALLYYHIKKNQAVCCYTKEREITIAPGHTFEVASSRYVPPKNGKPCYQRLDVIVSA